MSMSAGLLSTCQSMSLMDGAWGQQRHEECSSFGTPSHDDRDSSKDDFGSHVEPRESSAQNEWIACRGIRRTLSQECADCSLTFCPSSQASAELVRSTYTQMLPQLRLYPNCSCSIMPLLAHTRSARYRSNKVRIELVDIKGGCAGVTLEVSSVRYPGPARNLKSKQDK
jgi:hypothetical protein